MALSLVAGNESFLLDVAAHGAPDLLAFLQRQPVGRVDGVEVVLDHVQADVAGAAGAAGRDAAEAGVVLVLDAHLAAVAAVTVALAADAAADLARQVVVVFVAAAAAGAVAVEGGLDTVEGVLADERVVAAGLLDAAVGHDAEVVVVAEHPMHGGDVQRLQGSCRCRARAQAGLVEQLGDRADGVLSGGGEIEGQLDQRRAFGVDGDASDLAVLDGLADVEVAEASGAERAALKVLALLAKAHLLAVVARAEGVDAAHDGELEHAFGRVVDTLLGRLELGAVSGDLAQQPEGVELVAGAATEVVEDDVVGLEFGQVAEHPLQLGAVAGGGRLAGLDVLANDRGIEALGVSGADVALGRQRVTFAVDGGVDLSDRRDA